MAAEPKLSSLDRLMAENRRLWSERRLLLEAVAAIVARADDLTKRARAVLDATRGDADGE